MKRWPMITLGAVSFLFLTGQGEINISEAGGGDTFNPQIDEYTVEQNDTLWDITERVVGDPFQWPKVWAFNPEITNPHWIYPGDLIRFYPPDMDLPMQTDLIAGNMAMPDEPFEEEVDDGPMDNDVDSIGGSSSSSKSSPVIEVVNARPVRLIRGNTGRRFLPRFVSNKEMQEDGELSNSLADKMLLSVGDVVFLDMPSSKRPPPGTRMLIYRTQGEVYHPISGGFEGYLTEITGIVKVTSGADTSPTNARIEHAISDIERGQLVTPMDTDPRVSMIKVPTSKEVKGWVVAVRDHFSSIGGDNELVYIDKGKSDGLERGNQLRVWTSGDRYLELEDSDMRTAIAILQVVDARDKTSTCVVLRSNREVRPGAKFETVVKKGALPPKPDGEQEG